ncbi:hypothetical protein [Noviherbaspirillum suwonense]|uniref:Uncharacterized protein n=1 Tax=Noviherbaspirillum suwonense TaxID=1224511 RepID=A0ABY1QVD1_9BURK|nr:hypothetical protein [Noviherbaspirillum suwonense]SMP79705.1 hypothetical protein SAMN06295970_13237 [Noviherbaspirillum suwonense]
MVTGSNALQALLMEICEFGAAAEDHEITEHWSLLPLTEKARNLGVMVPAQATLDELRDAVEAACTQAEDAGQAGISERSPIATRDILGNEAGIPGDGP